MRTFLAANLGLGAFALFWIAIGLVGVEPAVLAGLATSAALTLWRAANREFRTLEASGFLAFAAFEAASRAGAGLPAGDAVARSCAALGVLSLVSCTLRRPWTAEYSRRAAPAEVGLE
jgi:hypothetical protein